MDKKRKKCGNKGEEAEQGERQGRRGRGNYRYRYRASLGNLNMGKIINRTFTRKKSRCKGKNYKVGKSIG